jgi:ubiquitin C-terminal hydrolase
MEIYKTPEYLIIHLKRFSHQRNSMFGSRKINMQIDFPVKSLDMTSYMSSEQSDEHRGLAANFGGEQKQKR